MSTGDGTDPLKLLGLARAGGAPALGRLLELYHRYLALLARLQIGRRLKGKVNAADLVQDTFLEAHRHFFEFRGVTEAELVCWLRQILAGVVANLLPRYLGTQRRPTTIARSLSCTISKG
jgi:RNA polymerase sigma-70 factor (ECF subfamily)